MSSIQKTFSYRLKTTEQENNFFAQYAGSARFVYNWGLSLIKQSLETQSKCPFYNELAKQLTLLKKDPTRAWLAETHSQILQQSLKDLDKSLKLFFAQRKKNKGVGFPRFKKKGIKDSFRYPQGILCENSKIFLPKIGWVNYYDSRAIEGVIQQATIKRDGNHWYVHIACEVPHTVALVPVCEERAVGIDLGLTYFASLSDGQVIDNPSFLKNDLAQLRLASRRLSRKQQGSNNHKKAARIVAKKHRKIRNKRNDFLHKVSTDLVKSHDIIAVENLSIKGMIQNRRLARSIADAGWARFVAFLKYKAQWFGKHLVQVGRFLPSSKQCSHCNQLQDMPLCIRRYVCAECGLDLDRDLNASINIRAAGLAVLNACGGIALGRPYEARIHGF